MKKDSFYFTHDYLARSDHKIKKLLFNHGGLGYGIYWAIIEDLYSNANELPMDFDVIAFDLRCNVDTVKSIIFDYDLFVIDGNNFSSNSVKRRLAEREEKSTKARKSAINRWGQDPIINNKNANEMQSQCERNANAMQTQCERNAIKEKKRKEKKENIFIKPTIEEVSLYCQEIGNKFNPERFVNYYETRGWTVGKNNTPMKDWRAAIRTWEINDPVKNINLGDGERLNDRGERTYGATGIIVPHSAPPRPSRNHYWVANRNEWEARV